MKLKLVNSIFVSASLIFSMAANSSPTEQNETAKSGIVSCGGSFFNRLSGTERHSTSYILRNLNNNTTIKINRIRVYNAQGVLIGNYSVPTLPPTRNSTLGPGNGNLIPHMSAHFVVDKLVLAGPLPSNERPIQVFFHWKAPRRVLMPEIAHVRNSRRFDIATNKSKEERGRHFYFCRHISINDR